MAGLSTSCDPLYVFYRRARSAKSAGFHEAVVYNLGPRLSALSDLPERSRGCSDLRAAAAISPLASVFLLWQSIW